MRTVVLMLVLLATLIACSTPQGSQSPPELGTIEFVIHAPTDPIDSQQVAYPAPDYIRVVITQTGSTYKAIKTIVYPPVDNTVAFSVPVGTDYIVDGFSAIKTTYFTVAMKHDRASSVAVTLDNITQVDLVLQPLTATLTLPTEVQSGSTYTATYSYDSPVYNELFGQERVWVKNAPFTSIDDIALQDQVSFDSTNSATLPAVTTDTTVTMYHAAEFYLNSTYLETDDYSTYGWWVFHTPLIGFDGSTGLEVSIVPPTGSGISIGITP